MIVINECGEPREWNDGFPVATVPKVLAYVVRKWNLKQASDSPFEFRENEPRITITLAGDLDDHNERGNNGLTGRFIPECAVLKPAKKSGRRIIGGRSDIAYLLPGQADLTLEFKKLDRNKRLRDRYRDMGIIKFVNGLYAENENVGVMVGMVNGKKDECVRRLEKTISDPNAVSQMKCLPDSDRKFIRRPSGIAQDTLEFDTLHSRSGVPDKPDKEDIRLGHLFLEFNPTESNPATPIGERAAAAPE